MPNMNAVDIVSYFIRHGPGYIFCDGQTDWFGLAFTIFQSYCDFEAAETQSLKSK